LPLVNSYVCNISIVLHRFVFLEMSIVFTKAMRVMAEPQYKYWSCCRLGAKYGGLLK